MTSFRVREFATYACRSSESNRCHEIRYEIQAVPGFTYDRVVRESATAR